MDKKEKLEFIDRVKVYDRIEVTYQPRFLCFKGKPETIEGIVGRLGLHSVQLVVPHPLGNGAELDRDNSTGWPCRVNYSQILDYEVVGNFLEENYPELVQ